MRDDLQNTVEGAGESGPGPAAETEIPGTAIASESDTDADSGQIKRLFARHTTPLKIEINNRTHQTVDWSLGGFRIADVGDLGLAGTHARARISIQYNDFTLSFEANAELIRFDMGLREAGFRFVDLKKEHARSLSYLVSGQLSGKVKTMDAAVKATLKTGFSGTEAGDTQSASPGIWPGGRALLQGAVATVLVVTTLALLRLIVLAFGSADVDAAWVDASALTLESPASGVVIARHAEEGAHIRPGDPLLTLTNEELEQDLTVAIAEHRRLEAARDGLKMALAGRDQVLGIQREIAKAARNRAAARVGDAAAAVTAAEDLFASRRKLKARGLATQESVNTADRARIEAQSSLSSAEDSLEEAEARLEIAEIGYFHGDTRATGDDPASLKRKIADLGNEIAVARARKIGLERRKAALSFPSPCDCLVLELPRRPGERITPGSLVAQLQDLTEPSRVIAFLPHAEARDLALGQSVTVRLPTGQLDTEAKIADIRFMPNNAYIRALAMRDLEPDRMTQLKITLSSEVDLTQNTAVEVTVIRSPLRWLERVFYFSV